MFEKFTSPETFVDLVVDGNIEKIKKIVESGYDVNKRTKYGAEIMGTVYFIDDKIASAIITAWHASHE